jgi:translation initiation factor 4G
MMVGGGVDIKRGELGRSPELTPGSIAFGTVDSPNPLLSSSPAAPSTTGAHLADTVKSFGSIEADASTDPNAVKAPSRRTSTLNSAATSPSAPPKKLDMHSLFTSKPPAAPVASPSPAADRRQSIGQQQFNGPPNSAPHPYGMMPTQPHLRAPPGAVMPGQPRSPVLAQAMPPNQFGIQGPQIQQGFRPQQPGMPQQNATQQGMVRPNGIQPGIRPNLMPQPPYGMPQGQFPMIYQQGYYVSTRGDSADSSPGIMSSSSSA